MRSHQTEDSTSSVVVWTVSRGPGPLSLAPALSPVAGVRSALVLGELAGRGDRDGEEECFFGVKLPRMPNVLLPSSASGECTLGKARDEKSRKTSLTRASAARKSSALQRQDATAKRKQRQERLPSHTQQIRECPIHTAIKNLKENTSQKCTSLATIKTTGVNPTAKLNRLSRVWSSGRVFNKHGSSRSVGQLFQAKLEPEILNTESKSLCSVRHKLQHYKLVSFAVLPDLGKKT